MNPFQALYGYLPPPLIPYNGYASKVQAVDELSLQRDQILHTVHDNLQHAQHMKSQADKHRRDQSLDIGSQVLVKSFNLIDSCPSMIIITPNLVNDTLDHSKSMNELEQWLITWNYLPPLRFTQSSISLFLNHTSKILLSIQHHFPKT